MATNKKILLGPGEGAYLPVLDITHKVTAQNFGGAVGWVAHRRKEER